ncbi:MAG TPA: OmpA family protein, partial [Saprospiraceae bacterium]|nr:OmpA family protein [Saprospiraceae bacterium]
DDSSKVTDVIDKELSKSAIYPIQFKWAEKQTETTSLFSHYKDSLINLLNNDGLLEITGYYQESELEGMPGGTDLGLLRAQEIKNKLFPELKKGEYKLLSKLNEKSFEKTNDAFLSSKIDYKKAEPVFSIGNKILYFPFRSSDITVDAEGKGYLEGLVKWMNETDGKVEVIGHTDNVGSKQINFNIGLKRAEQIKNYLVTKGISENNISVKSEGMMKPIATNDTEEGRAKNRRAEINTIQQ